MHGWQANKRRTCAQPVMIRAMPENAKPPAMRVDFCSPALTNRNKNSILLGNEHRVERQIRTPFLKADFHSDFVKILANTASIGCVFAASDQKSALEKSSTSMGEDFEGFVSQSGEGRLSPFKNDWGRKTRNIPH